MPLIRICLAFLLGLCINTVASIHWSHCDAVLFAASKFNTISTHHGPLFLSIVASSGVCEWKIYARPGYRVLMEVVESSLPSRCDAVYNISVHEGTLVWRTLLGSWCGQQTPTFQSSSSTLTIKFNSVIIDSDYGFSIRYKQITDNSGRIRSLLPAAYVRKTAWKSPKSRPPMQTVATTPSNKEVTSACSPVPVTVAVTEQEEILPCPSGQLNIQCFWRLTTQALNDSNFKVQVNIVSGNDDKRQYPCKDGYLQAFDGSPSTSPLLGKWCGQAIVTLVSSGQDLYLEYTAGTSVCYHDFKVLYVASRKTPRPSTASRRTSVNSIATVVGTVFGVVVLLLILITVTIFCTVYKKKKMATYDPHLETDPVYAVIGKSTTKSTFFINLPTVSETVCQPILPARDGCSAGTTLTSCCHTTVEKDGTSEAVDCEDPVDQGCSKATSDEGMWTSERTKSLSNVYGDLPTTHPSTTTC
ncbi:tolloid-like protein 1 [Haliotis cracherodii]|uniref:tolloid-like protein 1 n=1 Tax=Haliotis cracherodii TaxID=6455 RepID=UPI0039EAC01D